MSPMQFLVAERLPGGALRFAVWLDTTRQAEGSPFAFQEGGATVNPDPAWVHVTHYPAPGAEWCGPDGAGPEGYAAHCAELAKRDARAVHAAMTTKDGPLPMRGERFGA